ncbi:glycoside hydrolase [Morchella conica CCBAS932]|uniref:glucan 1,3-beta-glucosidase n=1 Tax=Morchella conica CCBAS932 TaxID=1392247 RepID=A0A3N4KAT0_9PEZI|nr:glycoside hydrolase [Morchella conica CCBAS932]
MNSEPFTNTNAEDEYSLCKTLGPDKCKTVLEAHWGGSWFNQATVTELANSGVNALRIPIGYWAFDNKDTPYVQGSAAWMDKAIEWARTAKMKVWVDLHGAPGSQNGFDNSGQSGEVSWQKGDNIERTKEVLKIMGKKYGSKKYVDVVVGIQLINEPISWGNNNFDTTYQFAVDAYWAVRQAAENKKLMVIMHDAFKGVSSWEGLPERTSAGGPESGLLGIDTHMYQCFVKEDKSLTQEKHVEKACGWATELKKSKGFLSTYVGEWSAATDICTYPDGTNTAGATCNVDGCQCQSNVDSKQWKQPMKDAVRRYMEAQLDAFEHGANGYFFWAFKGPGAWSWLNGVQQGWIPQPLDDRKFPNQCKF